MLRSYESFEDALTVIHSTHGFSTNEEETVTPQSRLQAGAKTKLYIYSAAQGHPWVVNERRRNPLSIRQATPGPKTTLYRYKPRLPMGPQ